MHCIDVYIYMVSKKFVGKKNITIKHSVCLHEISDSNAYAHTHAMHSYRIDAFAIV